uniref:Immunoglobulin V-set domain-containing protein n=1 Tax=Oreochromis aureus TaxID=47969 RepID=A0AAZ1WXI9_OREAU
MIVLVCIITLTFPQVRHLNLSIFLVSALPTSPKNNSCGGFLPFLVDRLYKTYQHESFKGRVELEDPNMKSGKMSIILQNTTVNDTGTYECHISYQTDHSQRSEMKQETKLKVTPAGEVNKNSPILLSSILLVMSLLQVYIVMIINLLNWFISKISISNNAKIHASIHFPPVLLLLCESQLSVLSTLLRQPFKMQAE